MRDFEGFAGIPPHPEWPGKARLALNFVLNLEEGAERSPESGDKFAESYGGEFPLEPKAAGVRNLGMESLFEYGSRAGFWRLVRIFDDKSVPLTLFACGQALERNDAICAYLRASPHEVAGHGWRWIDYACVDEQTEREHIRRTLAAIRQRTGHEAAGWYTGRRSAHTRRLLLEEGKVRYDSDSYADDLPYWLDLSGREHLVIPYTLDCNDFRYITSPGFATAADFLEHLKRAFDQLYREGAQSPKMMTVGLHGRISGRPARAGAVAEFIDYAQDHADVWLCRREEIAAHYLAKRGAGSQ